MSLVKCHECDNEISSEAKSCPRCGAKAKKPLGLTGKIIGGLFALSMIGVIASQSAPPPVKTPEQSEAEKQQSIRYILVKSAVEKIKESMRDPDSFVVEDARASDDGSLLCIEYRGRNGFGGMNREYITIMNGKGSKKPADWNKHCTKTLLDMNWATK